MKFLETWLREWVDPKLSSEDLCRQLTDAGFELESLEQFNEQPVIELGITPNRGDCLSILGIAREVALLNNLPLNGPAFSAVQPKHDTDFPVEITAKPDCPRYVGRVIRGIKANVESPQWIQDKLLAAGVRPISAVVDITNYVMLEMGQPMHAFDFAKLHNKIIVREAEPGEKLTLLDNRELTLSEEQLVIADEKGPLALAGVMGGLDSSVTDNTVDIFLEGAYFNPLTVRRVSKETGVQSESSYRFERGVDFKLQIQAMEHATSLVLQVVGGEAGPVIDVQHEHFLPEIKAVLLRLPRIKQILGREVPRDRVKAILTGLGFTLSDHDEGFMVTHQPHRHDIHREIDLIEEIARIEGYNSFPSTLPKLTLAANAVNQRFNTEMAVKKFMVARDFREVITYSFIDPETAALFNQDQQEQNLTLLNPISNDLSVMRPSLWPGLIKTLIHNSHRQQHRIRLFEVGLKFRYQGNDLKQTPVVAGLVSGSRHPEQWGTSIEPVDSFDLKADISALLKTFRCNEDFHFEAALDPVLHPGQTANIIGPSGPVGILGELHPKIINHFDLNQSAILFEVEWDALAIPQLPSYQAVSEFPSVRRDIAIIVEQQVLAQGIKSAIVEEVGDWLQNVEVFDVYQGKGIQAGHKSLAVGMVFQRLERTLTDDEVADAMERVVKVLTKRFKAELRN